LHASQASFQHTTFVIVAGFSAAVFVSEMSFDPSNPFFESLQFGLDFVRHEFVEIFANFDLLAFMNLDLHGFSKV
jgi:hypothetical protein